MLYLKIRPGWIPDRDALGLLLALRRQMLLTKNEDVFPNITALSRVIYYLQTGYRAPR